ncbi:unnamed protein product [Aspergillus oryzae var. brunneus]|uniref:chitinase n=1 Tax=Aspergillus oryzae var. brunneus TaxID=332754 RepID=A0ABQ6L933_ASPOZ|nr:unnamed protein product [Aspergillus oryzae var. brunneus]
MSSDMSEELFTQVAAVKDLKPSLKIYVSVGGWTFSDNDTVTQPLFGEIAADATKLVVAKSMRNSNLTWVYREYPGAGDRRGKPRDTDNYVKLLAKLRSTFNASGRKLGISFTAPSSYWYLKWFDLPGLLNGYTAPDCPFTTGDTSGPCTHTSGYLAYYEIQDLLDKNPQITPAHGKEAAFLHFTYDKDQWISYDDKTTFKQKLDWARSVGLGGSLIWASDQGEIKLFTSSTGGGDYNGFQVSLAQRNASVGRKHFVARIALSIILPWTAIGLVGMLALIEFTSIRALLTGHYSDGSCKDGEVSVAEASNMNASSCDGVDLCKIDSDYCDTTNLGTNYKRRDLEDPYDNDDYDTHSIERRAPPAFKAFQIRQWKIMIRAFPWPASGELFKGNAGKVVFKKSFIALGTRNNRGTFLLTEKSLNIVKGKIFDIEDKDDIFNGVIHNPTDPRKFDKALDLVAKSGTKEEELFDFIRRLFAEAIVLAQTVPGFKSLPAILKEVDADWYRVAASGTRDWVSAQLMLISLRYMGSRAANAEVVQTTAHL